MIVFGLDQSEVIINEVFVEVEVLVPGGDPPNRDFIDELSELHQLVHEEGPELLRCRGARQLWSALLKPDEEFFLYAREGIFTFSNVALGVIGRKLDGNSDILAPETLITCFNLQA